ncbi:MAG: EthD family reductase [Candidatus Binataceae bacterium]
MIHIHYFITRKPTHDDASFHRYWRETHGPIAGRIRQVHRYVQSHRIPYDGSNSPYDGEAEVMIDDLQALADLRTSKEYLEGALADERNFIDLRRVEWMATTDHAITEGPAGDHLIKGVWQIKRKPGMALAEFRRYWREVHGPIAAALPGLRRYVQSHLIDDAYLYAEPRFDGVAQLWFDSPEAMRAAFESPAGTASGEDSAKFVDQASQWMLVAREHTVVASK